MNNILRVVKGRIVERGITKPEGSYVIYEYLDINQSDATVERVENVAVNPNLANSLNEGAAFQLVDGRAINTYYSYQFLVALQKKNGDVIMDDKLVRYSTKARYFLAYLSLIPPLTLIAPLVFNKANKMKAVRDQVGVFEPLESKFIMQTKKKKF